MIPYGKRHPVVLRWVSIKNLTLLLTCKVLLYRKRPESVVQESATIYMCCLGGTAVRVPDFRSSGRRFKFPVGA